VNDSASSDEVALRFFKSIWENRELWSCFGYGTVEIVLNLPSAEFESLQEDQKRSLVRLLQRLARNEEQELRNRIEFLKYRDPQTRFQEILKLCVQLGIS
jgi:hypothetical protein